MFEVYGSKHSLFPRIWLVEAVGIGAKRSEFLTPFLDIISLKASQSHNRFEGVTPHMSGCRIPCTIKWILYSEAGENYMFC
jgi:hypothetical protein